MIINKHIERQENDDVNLKKAVELGGTKSCSRARMDKELRKALTPRTQWWERWRSHGDWWNYSPAEMLYKNLEWSRGAKNTFSLAKDSGHSLRFLSHTRQSEKMLLTESEKELQHRSWTGASVMGCVDRVPHLCSRCCCRMPRADPRWNSWTGRRWPRLTQRCNRY